MRVMLLSGAASIHTIRWANGLAAAGVNVHLVTQHDLLEDVDRGVEVSRLPFRGHAGYFSMIPAVKRLLRQSRPDILNAHYASGYGTTARYVNFHPYLLSVWGSDIYSVPLRSPLHRWWVHKNLMAADRVASTSRCMAKQTRSIAPNLGDIAITPFGVDIKKFERSADYVCEKDKEDIITIGTVKKLAWTYGIDILIQSFAALRNRLISENNRLAQRLRLRIVGDGPDRNKLEQLAREFGIDSVTEFLGRVPHKRVPQELAKFDVYVALSRLESFGVAVIEAGAAMRPVIVSDAGGLPEVVKDGETGFVVPRDNVDAATEALERLIRNRDLRIAMGEAAAAHVARNYSWDVSVATMITTLEKTVWL